MTEETGSLPLAKFNSERDNPNGHVHYPTDVSLLWDATRCLLRETGRAAEKYAVGGWRQWRHLSREVKKLFNKVRSTRRAQRHPERVEA